MEVISFKMLQILQFSIFLVRNLGIDAEMYSVQVPVMISTIGASEKNWNISKKHTKTQSVTALSTDS